MDLSVQNTNMPRPIEFDRSKAVNRALVLFWQKGYQATSLSDLLETTNISRSSFYAAFTDKRIFYIECLDLFAERTLELLQTEGLRSHLSKPSKISSNAILWVRKVSA